MSKSPQTDQVWRRYLTSGAPSELMELQVLCARFEKELGDVLEFLRGLKHRLLLAGYMERGDMISSLSNVITQHGRRPAVKDKDALYYQWSMSGELAVLHHAFGEPVKYNAENLRQALENVKARQSNYSTQEAWERAVRMFEAGIACMEAFIKAKGGRP